MSLLGKRYATALYALATEQGSVDAVGADLATIHAVLAGRIYIPSQVGEKLASRVNTDVLTEKELQILKQIADGASNKQIAKSLFISEGTVKFHSNSIYAKLGVASRTEAVKVATARGLLRS